MKIQITPTILVKSFPEFKDHLQLLEKYFSLVQIDCADGKFVKNKTFYEVHKVKSLKSKVSLELHLMVKEPLQEIKKWQGFKKVKRIIFHYEALKTVQQRLEIIKYLRQHKIKAGLAVNPETEVAQFLSLIPHLDYLLFLGVNPGWGGQKIQLKVVKSKVSKVRKLFPKLNIGVDGGVNLQNANQIVKSGADILAIGNSLSTEAAIIKFKKLIKFL